MYCDQNHGQMLCHVVYQADGMPWQMLLPYDVVADGKTTEADVIPLVKQSSRCYCHILDMWQMVSHSGCMLQYLIYDRCYCQVADGNNHCRVGD